MVSMEEPVGLSLDHVAGRLYWISEYKEVGMGGSSTQPHQDPVAKAYRAGTLGCHMVTLTCLAVHRDAAGGWQWTPLLPCCPAEPHRAAGPGCI